MNTWIEWGGVGGDLYKVSLAHFDPSDLLKLNYSDLWTWSCCLFRWQGKKKPEWIFHFVNSPVFKNTMFHLLQKRTKRTISRHHAPDAVESYYRRCYCFILLSLFFPLTILYLSYSHLYHFGKFLPLESRLGLLQWHIISSKTYHHPQNSFKTSTCTC